MAAVPATSSAAQFNWSAGGQFKTEALSDHVFTFGQGENRSVECSEASGEGNVTLQSSEFRLRVDYSKCAAFGVAVEMSEAVYDYGADGGFELVEPLTMTVLVPLFPDCTVTIAPQSHLSAVDYTNTKGGTVIVDQAIDEIKYSRAGSVFCPPSGTDGTLTGSSELGLDSGSVSWEP